MRLPRVRVRTVLILVAAIAILLAGSLEYRRLARLSAIYRYQAWGYGQNVRMRLQDLARAKQKLTRLDLSLSSDVKEFERLEWAIQRLHADIAANANLVQIYEHAASHPWETPPRVAEANSSVEDATIPKYFLANPARTPPPVLPDQPNPRVAAPSQASPTAIPVAPPAPADPSVR